jgi:protein-arginine kinase activator protein McsA
VFLIFLQWPFAFTLVLCYSIIGKAISSLIYKKKGELNRGKIRGGSISREIEPYIIKLEKRKRLKRVIINTKVEESAARMNIPKRLYIVIRI